MRGRLAAGCVAALLACAPGWAQEEERPKIYLEKKVFTETSEGRKSFYEVHAVEEGESLWKILNRRSPVAAADYTKLLAEFRRANPKVADPGRLHPGQKVLIPSAPAPPQSDPLVASGKAVAYRILKGDALTKILARRGVPRPERPRYLDAVKALNESVRNVDRILAGRTILLPTDAYFAGSPPEVEVAAAETAPPPSSPRPDAPVSPPAPLPSPPAESPPAGAALTKDVPASAAPEEIPVAKPEAQLAAPAAGDVGRPAEAAVARTADASMPSPAVPAAPTAKEEPAPSRPKPPYRGLLTDILGGLGEKWIDRGTLYLPVPSGGEVVLNLEDYPVARFSTGVQALVDFTGSLPPNVRRLIEESWKNYRVVSMSGAPDAAEMVDRLLKAAGYHSVKEGIAHPLVIGEEVSVSIPSRWVVLRTEKSLLTGEVILVKQVPEKPPGDLASVLKYADSVGIRVLPFAVDPSAREGFMVGIEVGQDAEPARQAPPPSGGLAAVDFSLGFLGIPASAAERLEIGGKGGAFRLTVAPERMFEAGGKRFVVDTGKLSPALRTVVQDSGYTVLHVGKDEPGRAVFMKVMSAAGIASEERRGFLVAGGERAGYEVRLTGTFVTAEEWLANRKIKAAAVVRGKVHSATRAMLEDFGVEIAGW